MPRSLHRVSLALVAGIALSFAAPLVASAQPGDPYLVRDLALESSVADRQTNPTDGLEVDGRLLVAWSGQGYGVLWSTDGTAAGSRSLAAGNGLAHDLVVAGHRAYFVVDGSGIWSSDGTVAGTIVDTAGPRVLEPRPNGLLWPVITRFTPSRVEVWIEQVSTGDLRYYDLPATDPDGGELSGLFDRDGFVP